MKVFLTTALIFGTLAVLAALAPKAAAETPWSSEITVETNVAAPSMRVSYGDVDIATPDGADVLLNRIDIAARLVCQPEDAHQLVEYDLSRRCKTEATDRAVADIGSPVVFARYRARSGHLPLTLTAEAIQPQARR
jgi:UrcA family protein